MHTFRVVATALFAVGALALPMPSASNALAPVSAKAVTFNSLLIKRDELEETIEDTPHTELEADSVVIGENLDILTEEEANELIESVVVTVTTELDSTLASIIDGELAAEEQEEPSEEEPSEEEPTPEEPSQEEPSEEEPSQEEPSQEEPSQEEPSQEEPSQEEPSQEEPSQEEPSQDEPSQEEPSQEESSE